MESLIEVGDELDQRIVLHELSHLWFNSGLVDGRWISEGLAEVFATAAVVELGGPPAEPLPIDPGAPGALALNTWSTPDLEREISEEQEDFGYNAAWSVIDQIADEIGLDALADVVRASSERTVAYAGPGLTELRGSLRWTQLLDLLEDRGGSALAPTLFERHVLTPDEQAVLPVRAASRQRYAAQVERGAGWMPPAAVRQALANWRFDQAEALMAQADAVLDVRDDIDDVLEGIEVATTGLEEAYEGGDDLEVVDEEAHDALAAARAVRAGDAAAGRRAGLLGAIASLWISPDDEVDEAIEAFEEGDWAEARERAERAVDLADGATRAGAVGLAGGLLLLTWVAMLLRRRSRRRSRPPQAEDLRDRAR